MVPGIQSWVDKAQTITQMKEKNRNRHSGSRYFSMNPLVEICSYKTFLKNPVTNTSVKIKRLSHQSIAIYLLLLKVSEINGVWSITSIFSKSWRATPLCTFFDNYHILLFLDSLMRAHTYKWKYIISQKNRARFSTQYLIYLATGYMRPRIFFFLPNHQRDAIR